MKQRFYQLMDALHAKGDIDFEYNALKQSYSESHRIYHNMSHINSVLKEFDSLKPYATNPLALELAIWYHDLVYDPKSRDNEALSALYLFDLKSHNNIDNNIIMEAFDLVTATKHKGILTTIDSEIITDCDIAIFGKSKKEFDSYESKIRKEYGFYSDEEYSLGRIHVLEKFLDRSNKKTIYHTDLFIERYESSARRNLRRSIEKLKAGLIDFNVPGS
jgi:predicted metal-dependent HD superfamily phosphohydrolase